MAFEVGAVIARLELVTKDFTQGIKKAEAKTADLRMALDQVSQSFGRITAVSGAALVAVTGALVLATRKGAQFDDALTNVASITRATSDELTKLSGIAREAGKTTVFSATEAADAMFNLASQGIKGAESFDALLKPILTVSAALRREVQPTAALTLSTIKAFGLENKEAARVVNVFSAANEASTLNLERLTEGLKVGGPVAKTFGLGVEDAVAVLGTLTDRGIQATEAGTSFRNILLNISKTTPKAKKILDRVGLTASKLGKLLKDPVELFRALAKAGLNAAETQEIFGKRAFTAASILIDNADAVERLREQITGTSSATEIAERQLQSFGNQMKLVGSAVADVAIALFRSLEPALRQIVNIVRPALLAFSEFIEKNSGLVSSVAQVTLVLLALVTGLGAFVTAAALAGVALLGLRVSMAGFSGTVPKATRAVKKLVRQLTPTGIGLANLRKQLLPANALIGKLTGKSLLAKGGLVAMAGAIGFMIGKWIDGLPWMDKVFGKLGDIVSKMREGNAVTGTASETNEKLARRFEVLRDKVRLFGSNALVAQTALKQFGDQTLGIVTTTEDAIRVIGILTQRIRTLREVQAQPVEGESPEEMASRAAMQQGFIDAELGFMDQRIEGGTLINQKKGEENEKQESLVEKIGQQINLEGKLGTVIDGVLAGTQGLGDSFGEFIKSIGKAIAKALVLQAIMLGLKAIFGGGVIGKLLGFSGGGVVPGAQMGFLPPREDVLVGVQKGEGILTQPAVRSLGGAAGIENLNKGGGVAGNTINNTFNFPSQLGITSEAVEQFRQLQDQMNLEFAPAT